MTDNLSKYYINRADQLFRSTERVNQEHQWAEIAEFVLNNHSSGFLGDTHSPGRKRTRRVFDSTATLAFQDLAAAIHSTLINPASMWSKMRLKNDQLNNDRSAIEWLEECNRIIHRTLNESNFDVQAGKSLQSYTGFGNMILLHESETSEDSPGAFDEFLFTALPLSQIAFEENHRGIVDSVYRRFRMTARQAVEKFGEENVNEKIKRCLEKDATKEFDFLHVISRRTRKKVKLNEFGLGAPENRPYESLFIDESHNELVEESGYYEFPVYVVRFNSMPGEVYGRGPSHTAINDIRSLNLFIKGYHNSVAKANEPPILMEDRNALTALDLRPGGQSVVRNVNGIKEWNTNANLNFSAMNIDRSREDLRKMYYLDKLLLPPRDQIGEMTAYEVAQRLEQIQKVLGPTISRLNSEFLSPLITRCFKILLRAGALPPVPPILQQLGVDIDIVFVNQLAKSQQIEDVANIQAYAQDVGLMAQIDPQAVDVLDVDGALKHIGRIRNVPEVAIKTEEEILEIRQSRAEQQQQQTAVEQGVGVADIISKTGLNQQ